MENQRQNYTHSVYVGNIAWRTTEQQLGDTFANFGYVNSAKIITDPESQRSRGYGFVEFADPSVIDRVIKQMNEYNLNGRKLRVGRASGGQQRQQQNNNFQNQYQNNFTQQQGFPQQQQQGFNNAQPNNFQTSPQMMSQGMGYGQMAGMDQQQQQY